MDERTEGLRDIFRDVADDDTVTESQAERRGTLADDVADVDGRLADVVERMRERFAFETDLEPPTYAAVVRGYYRGRDDDELADDLGLDPETVFAARADLHLVDEIDAGEVDLDPLRNRVAEGQTAEAAVAAADVDDPERVAAVLAAMLRSRRVSHRFRSAFEEILTDADISVRLTAATREDGLEEVTEDAEVDVDF